MTSIPVLLYHSVAREPSSWIARYTVSPETFARHMDAVVASDRTPMTVSALRAALHGEATLPRRPVVITFDDGFANTLSEAAPVLADRELPATVYVTTGVLDGRSPGGDAMLGWAQLPELIALGHEIGGHTHTHPQLDTMQARAVRDEVTRCKDLLEQRLGTEVRSFAYPYGYSNPRVRRIVREAGYDSACSVKNALSPRTDPPYSIARLAVTMSTTQDRMARWLAGTGARVAHPTDTMLARAWRAYRWTRVHLRPETPWGTHQTATTT